MSEWGPHEFSSSLTTENKNCAFILITAVLAAAVLAAAVLAAAVLAAAVLAAAVLAAAVLAAAVLAGCTYHNSKYMFGCLYFYFYQCCGIRIYQVHIKRHGVPMCRLM